MNAIHRRFHPVILLTLLASCIATSAFATTAPDCNHKADSVFKKQFEKSSLLLKATLKFCKKLVGGTRKACFRKVEKYRNRPMRRAQEERNKAVKKCQRAHKRRVNCLLGADQKYKKSRSLLNDIARNKLRRCTRKIEDSERCRTRILKWKLEKLKKYRWRHNRSLRHCVR